MSEIWEEPPWYPGDNENDDYPYDPDGYDRNGVFDGFQVTSDADPGL